MPSGRTPGGTGLPERNTMLPWIIAMFVALAACVGCCAGFLLAAWHGGRLAHDYADWLTENRTLRNDTGESVDDEQERLDALAIRDLTAIGVRIYNDSAAGYALQADYRRQLGEALEGCERLRDWIEWAEGAPETKQAPAPAEAEDDDPYADLTLRDVDPDAVYATEDDDYYEERAEARDGAAV